MVHFLVRMFPGIAWKLRALFKPRKSESSWVSFNTPHNTYRLVQAICDTFPPSCIVDFEGVMDEACRKWLSRRTGTRDYGIGTSFSIRLDQLEYQGLLEILGALQYDDVFSHIFVNDDANMSVLTVFDLTVPPNQVDVNTNIGEDRVRHLREMLE